MISTYPLTGEVTKKAFAVTGKKYQNFALYPSFHHPLFFKGKSLCNSIGLYLDHLTETSGKKVNAQCKTHKNITEKEALGTTGTLCRGDNWYTKDKRRKQ